MKRRMLFGFVVMVAATGLGFAADPPDLINFQGVLRDSNDAPVPDDDYDMIFTFWSAEVGGDEIASCVHVGGRAVAVTGGLFNVLLGEPAPEDGPSHGEYGSLTEIFGDYGAVWLAIEVDGEELTPRIQVAASGYALNAASLGGRSASGFLDTSAASQVKAGNLVAGSASGTGADVGVEGYGNTAGGYFEDADGFGHAYLGYGNSGVGGFGNITGGYFRDLNSSGYARLGYGNYGVQGYGDQMGGYFKDTDGSGYAYLGRGDYGIEAHGNHGGGYFTDLDGSGDAILGHGDRGIEASGSEMGGFFANLSSGHAYLAYNDIGVSGYGDVAGGYFAVRDGWAYAEVGVDAYKIRGNGTDSFVQNHPDRADRVVVYHAPEASEVAVYTRGSAQLENGVARSIRPFSGLPIPISV